MRYVCPGCDYAYDEQAGDAREGFAPGTPWSEIPDDWACPDWGPRYMLYFVPAFGSPRRLTGGARPASA